MCSEVSGGRLDLSQYDAGTVHGIRKTLRSTRHTLHKGEVMYAYVHIWYRHTVMILPSME